MAKVSIGMPAYNAEAHISRAVESLRAQTFTDFELIFSDNTSTDRTAEIMAFYVEQDSRIQYTRQTTNIGAFKNFKFVLDKAVSSYFMWAAADDYWAPEYIDECVRFMDEHADYVACVSKAAFDNIKASSNKKMGTYALTGTFEENIRRYVLAPEANTRFYGLHRTQILRDAWLDKPFWAADWAIVCRALSCGKYHELPRILMTRNPYGVSSKAYAAIRELNAGPLRTAFPYLTYSRHVLSLREARYNVRIIFYLLWLNADAAIMMFRKWLSCR
jgi:glycosyltransferase involved in cell wall biosynthesis